VALEQEVICRECGENAADGYDRCPTHLGWTGRLIVVCCVCGKDMGQKPCVPKMNGWRSHSICKNCEPQYRLRVGLGE
jgi:hypothetical protein